MLALSAQRHLTTICIFQSLRRWCGINTNRATRLRRTVANQTQALGRYRGKGEQKMTVEHLHVCRWSGDFPTAGVMSSKGGRFSRPPKESGLGPFHGFTTCRLLVTEKMLGTLLARIVTRFLSASLSITPSRVTRPFFTMIRMGFCTPRAYFSSGG